jgi:hypothetical protein
LRDLLRIRVAVEKRPGQKDDAPDPAEEVPDLVLGVVEVSRRVTGRAADEEEAQSSQRAETAFCDAVTIEK